MIDIDILVVRSYFLTGEGGGALSDPFLVIRMSADPIRNRIRNIDGIPTVLISSRFRFLSFTTMIRTITVVIINLSHRIHWIHVFHVLPLAFIC